MREILYFQAGTVANYVGQHFWNTQESYLAQDAAAVVEGGKNEGSAAAPLVSHERSFFEHISETGEVTYCPRLLLFDRKANFGFISGLDSQYVADDALTETWAGEVVQYARDAISQSKYQQELEKEGEDEERKPGAEDTLPSESDNSEVRFWSDYNRVYYHSQSLQRLPDVPEWENQDGHWAVGKELFAQHDHDAELMDGPVRKLMEDCDLAQGIQVTYDAAPFGGFTNAFLVELCDLAPKLTTLTFVNLSDANPLAGLMAVDDSLGIRKVVNDAYCLKNLSELSRFAVPIEPLAKMQKGSWCAGTEFDSRNLYHTSSILSAHIESVTLPARLQQTARDLSMICDDLSWRGGRFGHLDGSWSMPSENAVEEYDFSRPSESNFTTKETIFARLTVARGVNTKFEFGKKASLESRTDAPAYPLPTSLPSIFDFTPPKTRTPGLRGTTSLLSSLTTGTHVAPLFRAYASFVEKTTRTRSDAGADLGLEKDEMHELASDLWTLHDGFAEEEASGGDVAVGEDENEGW